LPSLSVPSQTAEPFRSAMIVISLRLLVTQSGNRARPFAQAGA
jgi:hypothetical protein